MSTSGQTLAYLPAVRLAEPEVSETDFAVIGEGAATRKLLLQIDRIGPHFRTVLVHGEIGTGKELVARALHERSGGSPESFILCNSGSVEELMDPGDIRNRSLMRIAGARTLFVDGVEDLSMGTQWQLLRLLEQRMLPKMIASASRNLRGMAASGGFRQDLYHRLAMVEIAIEPLRRRREEIPGLVMHFVKRFSSLYERHIDAVDADAMERLCRHAWPGNVRELENVVRNAVLQCETGVLAVEDLSSLVELIEGIEDKRLPGETPVRLDDVVRQHVIRVLRDCSGNKVRAAEMLGISRSTLYRMLEGCSLQS
jgi:DNA-binding NtrC family response regulator